MESSQVEEVYMKTMDGACSKSQISSIQASQVVELTSHQLKIATKTLQQTDTILCQLIEKFNQYDMEGIVFNLEKEQCQALLTAVRSNIKFKYDPEGKTLYAYVYPSDKSHTVYLGPKFFKTNDEIPLSKDSKIGTLIHELSHFKDVIGTHDLSMDAYQKSLEQFQPYIKSKQTDKVIKELEENKKDFPKSAYKTSPVGLQQYDIAKSFNNANNLEYEIELRYAHDGEYEEDVWQCCNENKYVSICQIKSKYVKQYAQTAGKAPGYVHWGLYHCGEQEDCKHNGYPYCTCEESCKIKRWTCCGQKDFNDGYGCPKKYRNEKIGEWEDVQLQFMFQGFRFR